MAHLLQFAVLTALMPLPRERDAEQENGLLPTNRADGHPLAALSDVDGDGVEDVAYLAGADTSNHLVVVSGADGAQIFEWSTSESPAFASALDPVISVAGVGDIDCDGVEELGLGTGKAVALVSLSRGLLCIIESPVSPASRFGYALAGGADFDGDAIPDLVVGAPASELTHSGAVFAYSGASLGKQIIRWIGPAEGVQPTFGASLAMGGEGASKRPGIAIGGPGYVVDVLYVRGADERMEGLREVGSVWIFDGFELVARMDHPYSEPGFGSAVSFGADIDGDGIEDLLVASTDDALFHCYGRAWDADVMFRLADGLWLNDGYMVDLGVSGETGAALALTSARDVRSWECTAMEDPGHAKLLDAATGRLLARFSPPVRRVGDCAVGVAACFLSVSHEQEALTAEERGVGRIVVAYTRLDLIEARALDGSEPIWSRRIGPPAK